MGLETIIICAAGAWRTGYFIIKDLLFKNERQAFLDRVLAWGSSKKSKSQKQLLELTSKKQGILTLLEILKREAKEQDNLDEMPIRQQEKALVEVNTEIRRLKVKRSASQSASFKFRILMGCIYCITFWTSVLIYNSWQWVVNIAAIWAFATIIGVYHDVLVKKYGIKEDFEEDED